MATLYARVVGTDLYLPKEGEPVPMGDKAFSCELEDTDRMLSWLQVCIGASKMHEKLEIVHADGQIFMSNTELESCGSILDEDMEGDYL